MARTNGLWDQIEKNPALKKIIRDCTSVEEVMAAVGKAGIDLGIEQIEELAEIDPDDLAKVAGGVDIDPAYIIRPER